MLKKFGIDDLTIELPKVEKKRLKIKGKFVKEVPKAETKYGYNKRWENIIKNSEIWEKYKLFVNPYILINLSGIEKKYMSNVSNKIVSKKCNIGIDTISRAFYKLWEILKEFDLLPNHCLKSANIAEGPGGFMQAIIEYRKKYYPKLYKCDKLIGITLKEGETEHLEFTSGDPKIINFMLEYKNRDRIIDISYGANNGNGNLNKLNNILGYARLFQKVPADLVTADGGFPTTYDWMIQEQLSSHLIYNEIVTALSVQKKGGNFVCKTFALNTKLSSEFLYLLANYYEKVYITKPVTSRITNNEHYIVAKEFRGIDKKSLEELYKITEEWYKKDPFGGIKMPEYFVESIIDDNIPKKFTDMIKKYNEKVGKIQFQNIEQISKLNKNDFKNILKQQEKLASEWCNKYFYISDVNTKSQL